MRVAIVFFEGKSREKTLAIVRGLAKGIESKGHQVDIVDGDHDVNSRLTVYQYICIGTSAINFFGGKISEKASTFLPNAGVISGKRSFAFAVKGGRRISKTLSVIMKMMEKEGMYLKYSEVLTSAVEAEAIGKRLHIE
ncbi:MAG: hypothetical protein HN368_01040 [Spirochaetales bacterium]|jgi:menaquinone-dependent protoporphyrinogen IX oxidase|nr:hypothetical protein [Spirochaetales bacterium]